MSELSIGHAKETSKGFNELSSMSEGKQILHELFSVCEDTEDECAESDDPFKRGRAFEAKRIRRGIGTWYQDNFIRRYYD